MEINRLVHKSRRRSTNKGYQHAQRRFIECACERHLDPPSTIVNYLAYGCTHLNWVISTCLANRLAILDLYDFPNTIKTNPAYIHFIKSLTQQATHSFVHPSLDIQSALEQIRSLGLNTEMSPLHLPYKTCFLFAITGFMRPFDLHRVEQVQSQATLLMDLRWWWSTQRRSGLTEESSRKSVSSHCIPMISCVL